MNITPLIQKTDQLRNRVREEDPKYLARRVEAEFVDEPGNAKLVLPWWGSPVHIRLPEFVAFEVNTQEELRPDAQAMILYHLASSDGYPVSGKWISFHDLPEGKFYAQAFQGYTGGELRKVFGNQADSFASAAQKAGGRFPDGENIPGDKAYAFRPLPRIPLLAAYWEGDDEMPASAQILFDASSHRHLPTDACAILGSMLARRIMRAARS
jgi:hypothetical protein